MPFDSQRLIDSGSKQISALSLVGMSSLAPSGPNLLQEKLAEDKAGQTKSLGWNVRELKSRFSNPESETAEAEPEVEEVIEPETQEAPEPKTQETKEDLPAGFHSLNEMLQQEREERLKLQAKLEANEQYVNQQRIWQEQNQRQQAANQPNVYAQLAEEQGVDPVFLEKFATTILQQANNQVAPINARQEAARFQSIVADLKRDPELALIDKYFPGDALAQTHEQAMRRGGIAFAQQTDWAQEIRTAYASQDYKRLAAENKKLKEGAAKTEHKAEQKKALAMVPKASHQSSTIIKANSQKREVSVLGQPRAKVGFDGFASDLKARLGLKK